MSEEQDMNEAMKTQEVVEAEVVDVVDYLPAVTEQDILEGFQMIFNEIVIIKNALAENCRKVAELEARNENNPQG